MQNPRLAARYAKSILDLAIERNSLDAVLKDMQAINRICQASHDFEVMLRSPVISGDKKLAVINMVLKNYDINTLTKGFIDLLVNKSRELNLPEIAAAFVAQYNTLKNIRIVKLTTASAMNDAIKSTVVAKIASYMPNDTIELTTEVDESLIGGFVLETDDKLYDASIKKSLNDVRSKVVDTSYVNKM